MQLSLPEQNILYLQRQITCKNHNMFTTIRVFLRKTGSFRLIFLWCGLIPVCVNVPVCLACSTNEVYCHSEFYTCENIVATASLESF